MTGPAQHRPAALPGLAPRVPICLHLLGFKMTQHTARKEPFDEDVVLQYQSLAFWSPNAVEEFATVGKIVAPQRCNDGLHIGDAFKPVGVVSGPMEAQHRSPVVQ